MIDGGPLARRLRLIVITDARLAAPRGLVDVVGAALRGGARAVQLRDKDASARDLVAGAERLGRLCRDYEALLFVNDRVDVALAAGAHGVHLGPDDLPVAAARSWAPRGFLVGASCDDPETARRAEVEGADYIGCGAVFPTATKDVGDEAIGTGRLDQVARAVSIPVVGIGGVTPDNSGEIAGTAAAGCAVVGAVMTADDPERAARALIAPFLERGPG